jgi:hypothetical protein
MSQEFFAGEGAQAPTYTFDDVIAGLDLSDGQFLTTIVVSRDGSQCSQEPLFIVERSRNVVHLQIFFSDGDV